MNNFQKWQNQDSSNKNRILALGIGALIFPITIPVFLIIVLPQVDNYFGISSFFVRVQLVGWNPCLEGFPGQTARFDRSNGRNCSD